MGDDSVRTAAASNNRKALTAESASSSALWSNSDKIISSETENYAVLSFFNQKCKTV